MIEIIHGIYDITLETAFKLGGYFHDESKIYLPMSNKLKHYLVVKGRKFLYKYNIKYLRITLGRDADNGVETVAVIHPFFDSFIAEIGEKVVFGRIRRMRGDLKKVVYETEMVEKKVFLYYKINKTTKIKEAIYKTVEKKQVKYDSKGNPIVKREIYFKPYNLDRRYHIKHKDGSTTAEELMYPYIYKLTGF